MTAAELSGQVVMVHPELHDDPAAKTGEIGSITAADLSEDLVLVKFQDERTGFYAANALLVFKPSEHIYLRLKRDAIHLDPGTFKDLKNIALMLDYGTPKGQLAAMQIAQKNPAAVSTALVSLEDSLGINQTYKWRR